uniref:Xin actin binding repeat containing 2 n=1 Tax=Nothoprocta perdicaria TaxID=30464 RepID=A0A8C6YN05_NOTPE
RSFGKYLYFGTNTIKSRTYKTFSFPSPEQSTSPTKSTIPKDLYSKQRNVYELKRLYKHIHPELRKNVQSMRWIFENQPLDSIKDDSPDPDKVKSIAEQEMIVGGDVKYTTWMFETQPIDALGAHSSESAETTDKIPELARGDVRTATWMFETQPLDSMNKIYHDEEQTPDETCVREIPGGDVKTVKYMFETQNLDKLGQLYSEDEVNLLQLRSELKEIKGNVKRSIKHFETRPLYVIRDNLGQILEIKTVHREDIEKGDVRTARWMFETQPLDMINKDSVEIKVLRGISMEENVKGGVHKAKWLFETQPLDTIKEDSEETIIQKETILGTDVSRKCWIFETQPLDALKENDDTSRPLPEEIIGGDVSGTKHLFETLPMDALKDSLDVGRLQKVVATDEEKGNVTHQKWVFETKPLEQIREERKEFVRTVKLEEIDRGDVNSYKKIFESSNLKKYDESQKIYVEGVVRGAVELNKALFETTPLYAIQDSHGKYHEVRTIRQEEILRGDVRSCRWLFETRSLDQFDESDKKIQIIKGISSQEVISGDVKTAKWLFETQPLDAIKHFGNVGEEEEIKAEQRTDIVKGDVKTCRWLFETQPMESLYDKVEVVTDSEEIHKGDVKACTQLFETQSLDAIKDGTETTKKLHTVNREDIQGSDVRTACCLFETENLENIQGEEDVRTVTKEEVQEGDVQHAVWVFENQPLDSIKETDESEVRTAKEDIPQVDVKTTTWLFETTPFHEFNESKVEKQEIIGKSIKETLKELYSQKVVESHGIIIESDEIGDVRMAKYKLMNQKAPEIQKEEIIKGDLGNIMMNLLSRKSTTKKEIVVNDDEKGNVNLTKDGHKIQRDEVIGGDVKRTIHRLLSSIANNEISERAKIEENERGNVQFFTTCIEAGALDYLKLFQTGSDETSTNEKQEEDEEIIAGDVEGTKLLLKKHRFPIQRTPKWPPEGFAQDDFSLHANKPLGNRKELQKENIHSDLKEQKKNDIVDAQQNQCSSFSSVSAKGATSVCEGKTNEIVNKGKDEETENVQDKPKKTGGSQAREESVKDSNECVHIAEKGQEKKNNETYDVEVVQVTNIDDETVQKNEQFGSNNTNNNNNTIFSHVNICSQETSLSATSNPVTKLSHKIFTAFQHAFEKLEDQSGNEAILEIPESQESYSSDCVTVSLVEQNCKDKDAVTCNSLVQFNKDAICQKSCAHTTLILREATNTTFPNDAELVCTGEESEHDQNVNITLSDTMKTSYFLHKDSLASNDGLLDAVDITKNSSSPYSKEHGNYDLELNDINDCQEDEIIKVSENGISTSSDLLSSRHSAVPSSQRGKVKSEQLTIEEQIKRNRFYDENE